MTAIDRTAYPRPGLRLTREELRARYALTETDLTFIRLGARGEVGRLMLATLLKARQDLGYFPMMDEVHADTVADLALQLNLTAPVWPDEAQKTKSLYRYQAAVRTRLSCAPKGAFTLWVQVPPGQWSVGPVAGRRLGWVTGWV